MPNLVQYPHDKWTIHQNKTGDDYSAATYSPSTEAVLATTALDGKMRLHGKGVQVSERALELATALEAELLGQFDKLEATMQRPEFASFPIDERNEIERKHAEISGLLTQADFMKYQISRL